MQTTQDLFRRSKQEWLDEAREAARQLLKKRYSITIEDVLKETPRPGYVGPNTVGRVFNHTDFIAVDYAPSKRPESHKRKINIWKLRADYIFATDDEEPAVEWDDVR